MSVINKMLRDLDSRQAQGAAPVQGNGPVAGMTRGTFSVDPASGQGRRGVGRSGVWAWLLALLALLIGAAVAAWWLWWRVEPARPVAVAQAPAAIASAPVPMPAPAQPAVAAASAPMAAASAPAVVELPAASAPLAAVSAVVPASSPATPVAVAAVAVSAPWAAASKPMAAPVVPLVPVVAPAVAASAPPKAPAVPVAAKPASAPAAAKPAAAKPDASPATAAPASRAAPAAAMETLAQAQGLWNAGSREAALETLRDGVASAERANLATQPGGMASFVMLVRELCRMELAEGHTAQVMTLLTRLEPVLADQPDVWALRGNAAQRLGRHPESAAAYLAALRLRPGEPRWMLGAAVSLAAQGQTTAAAEWAEKARAAGVVSPEVLNYLRQMGVPLR